MRKSPRDFVHIDELWDADSHWSHYFHAQKVWVYVDEYRAELIGDQDYSRICVQADDQYHWQLSKPLAQKSDIEKTITKINRPVSERQLKQLGFVYQSVEL